MHFFRVYEVLVTPCLIFHSVSIRTTMAFWGVEVKPGKPFAHKCDGLGGRLHISMATLGFGCATAKSILQCNVGNKSPVYLCSLSSGMSESLQLNLEFEEVDDVIFSVVGPRSIHLCGYYLGRGQNTNINEESESYGEDIANTETERSDYNDEDDYEDSFIDDDGDPEVYPPSPISDEEEASKVKKSRGRHRRLRRKYRSVESDDDKSFEENKIVDSNMHDHAKTPDEDSMPISSLFKRKPIARVLDLEMDVSDDTREGDSGNKNGVDGCNGISNSNSKDDNVLVNSQTHSEGADPLNNIVEHCTGLDIANVQKVKKKKKEKEGKYIEGKGVCSGQSVKPNTVMEDELKLDNMAQDLPVNNGQNEVLTYDREVELPGNVALPSSEMDPEKGRGMKRKRKELAHKGSHFEGGNTNCENVNQEYKASRDEAVSDNVIFKFPEEKDQDQKGNTEEGGDNATHDFPDENQSEDRKIKKRKKKNKSKGNIEVNSSDMPLVSVDQNNGTIEEDKSNVVDAKPSQVRTLPNGLIIEVLEMGREDGKIAAPGRKISISYTGKLKDNGEVFESNIGHSPLKFRLGKGDVIQGWNVGLEGMQVGEKRRLTIPPSMGFGTGRHGENVPPNSWLVYDFELVKVR